MYKIIPATTIVGDFIWSVYEDTTEQFVESFFFEDDAKKFVKFNERGGAFAGFTPTFMTTRGYKPKNIDEEFSASFEVE